MNSRYSLYETSFFCKNHSHVKQQVGYCEKKEIKVLLHPRTAHKHFGVMIPF